MDRKMKTNEFIVQTSTDIVQTQNVAVLSQEKMDESIRRSLVINKKDDELKAFVVKQVGDAYAYRGISPKQYKDENGKIVYTAVEVAKRLFEVIKQRFPYLTLTDLQSFFMLNSYGAEFSNTVSVDAFVSCIENSNYVYTQQSNRETLKEFERQQKIRKEREKEKQIFSNPKTARVERIQILKRGFNYWKMCGHVDDVGGKIWESVCELQLSTQPKVTLRELKSYLRRANAITNRHFALKHPEKWGNAMRVKRDRLFRRSKEYRETRRYYFREYWLRDFFAKSKWNKEYNDNQKQQ